jgi:hypothetical protein
VERGNKTNIHVQEAPHAVSPDVDAEANAT